MHVLILDFRIGSGRGLINIRREHINYLSYHDMELGLIFMDHLTLHPSQLTSQSSAAQIHTSHATYSLVTLKLRASTSKYNAENVSHPLIIPATPEKVSNLNTILSTGFWWCNETHRSFCTILWPSFLDIFYVPYFMGFIFSSILERIVSSEEI